MRHASWRSVPARENGPTLVSGLQRLSNLSAQGECLAG